jgi:hypothetical protein
MMDFQLKLLTPSVKVMSAISSSHFLIESRWPRMGMLATRTNSSSPLSREPSLKMKTRSKSLLVKVTRSRWTCSTSASETTKGGLSTSETMQSAQGSSVTISRCGAPLRGGGQGGGRRRRGRGG